MKYDDLLLPDSNIKSLEFQKCRPSNYAGVLSMYVLRIDAVCLHHFELIR